MAAGMWEIGRRTGQAGWVELFALGEALASEVPAFSSGQKGRLSRTPLMKNIYSKQTLLLVLLPTSNRRGDCDTLRPPSRRWVGLLRPRGA